MAEFWICLVVSQGFKWASGSKYARAQNMVRLWIFEGYTGCWICLNRPEYALIMSQYVWICHNNAEYDWICWHTPEKTVLNMPELFWMCLMQYIALDHCTIYWAVTETEKNSEHGQKFKIERFAKRIMPEYNCTTKNFSGQDGESGNCGTGHLQKEAPQGSILELFLLDILNTTFLMENLIQWWTQSRRFIPNSGYSFRFSKRTREGSPLLPNCVPVSVVEYASISLNMPKYRWKCLNKLLTMPGL